MPYKDPAKQAMWAKLDRQANPEKYQAQTQAWKAKRRSVKGLGTLDQSFVEALWLAQDKQCAICKIDIPKTAHIDHDHETKKLRGLLCRNCNPGLGQFKDNPAILDAAAAYLRKHKS